MASTTSPTAAAAPRMPKRRRVRARRPHGDGPRDVPVWSPADPPKHRKGAGRRGVVRPESTTTSNWCCSTPATARIPETVAMMRPMAAMRPSFRWTSGRPASSRDQLHAWLNWFPPTASVTVMMDCHSATMLDLSYRMGRGPADGVQAPPTRRVARRHLRERCRDAYTARRSGSCETRALTVTVLRLLGS